MRPGVLTAFEHETLAIEEHGTAGIAPLEARHLLDLAASRPGFCVPGHRSIRLSQYAGLVNLGGRILEILPKVGETATPEEARGTFLRLLGLAGDVPLFSGDSAGHDLRRQSLLSVFISIFQQEVMHLVRRGLLRRYSSEFADLRVIRGRLEMTRQIVVHGMRPDVLACRFDELTLDNHWNQVLRAALAAVRPWIDEVAEGRRWLELMAAFDGVTARRDAATVAASLEFDRQAIHYRPAIQWARLILRLLSPSVRAGAAEAPELLFDMNRVFESAVASAFARRMAAQVKLSKQDGGRHLAERIWPTAAPVFRLRPDLVARRGEQVLAVGDTKWIRIESDRRGNLIPEQSHAYQMHAYASAYDCDDFCLIYPYHAGLSGVPGTSFQLPTTSGRAPKLHMICIDVGKDDLPVVVGSGTSLFGEKA